MTLACEAATYVAVGLGVTIASAILIVVLVDDFRARRRRYRLDIEEQGEGLAVYDPRVVGDGAWLERPR